MWKIQKEIGVNTGWKSKDKQTKLINFKAF